MSAKKIPTPRAGEILKEAIDDLGISQYRLAAETGIPQGRISGIIHGRNGITPAIALRLSAFLGSSCEYWLNLQRLEDVERAREALAPALARIARFPASSLPAPRRRPCAPAPSERTAETGTRRRTRKRPQDTPAPPARRHTFAALAGV